MKNILHFPLKLQNMICEILKGIHILWMSNLKLQGADRGVREEMIVEVELNKGQDGDLNYYFCKNLRHINYWGEGIFYNYLITWSSFFIEFQTYPPPIPLVHFLRIIAF